MSIEPQRTIAAASFEAISAFNRLITTVDESDDKKPELSSKIVVDERGRFHVWAGNIGALQSPISAASLDSRLSDAPQVQRQVLMILERLIQSIKKGEFSDGLLKRELMIISNIYRLWRCTKQNRFLRH